MAFSRLARRRKLRSLWRLGGLTPWQLATSVVHATRNDDLGGRASELAFNFLLALFPLLLFMLALIGLFASRSSQLETSLLSYFADFLPLAAFQLLRDASTELAAHPSGGKLTFGILLALWFAAGGVSSMISTLNGVYRVSETRSWLRVRLIALGLTLAISILLLSALFLVLAGSRFADWMGSELQLRSAILVLGKQLQWPAALLFVMVSFSLIYYYGPDLDAQHRHWLTPGAVFGALLWMAASAGFRGYLHFFNTYSATYGSVGAVMILLIWLYGTGFAFLVGGEINAEIERSLRAIYPGRKILAPSESQ